MQALALIIREHLPAVERKLLKMPQIECPVVHRFGPGIYIREVFIPAGTLAIGHHHVSEHTNIMLKGVADFLMDDGSIERREAPYYCVAPAGRKIAYVYEDMVWQNIYATDETDIVVLEATLLDISKEWLEHEEGLEKLQRIGDQMDFLIAAEEGGWSLDLVRKVSENTDDAIGLPHGTYKFKIAWSQIEGKGVVAASAYEPFEVVGPARIGDRRTVIGRYTNHAKRPNAMMSVDGDTVNLIVTKPISVDEEITVDYRKVLLLHTGDIS